MLSSGQQYQPHIATYRGPLLPHQVLSVSLTCKSPHSSSTTDLISRTTKKFYTTFTSLVTSNLVNFLISILSAIVITPHFFPFSNYQIIVDYKKY